MGLDMYLMTEIYLSEYGLDENGKELADRTREIFPEMYRSGNLNSVTVSFEAGYWRKVNAVHEWFVENVQDGVDDCGTYYVAREQLEELLSLCETILENPDKGPEELPTKEGFFFGSTDYDEYYLNDLQHTVNILKKALSLPKGWAFEYHSSW